VGRAGIRTCGRNPLYHMDAPGHLGEVSQTGCDDVGIIGEYEVFKFIIQQ
jgi:hypothetical protein